jgi:hypothetical protein
MVMPTIVYRVASIQIWGSMGQFLLYIQGELLNSNISWCQGGDIVKTKICGELRWEVGVVLLRESKCLKEGWGRL